MAWWQAADLFWLQARAVKAQAPPRAPPAADCLPLPHAAPPAQVRELLESGKRPTGMCSRRRAFPMLQKGEELCRMDGRRIWSAFQRWLRGRQGGQAAQPPLALEMASRQLEGGT